jgi:hypothetical protein
MHVVFEISSTAIFLAQTKTAKPKIFTTSNVIDDMLNLQTGKIGE